MRKTLQNLGIVGLGKLGACMAAALASRGFNVVGIDADPSKVDAIGQKRSPVQEPRLQETLDHTGPRLTATHSYCELVERSGACFFITPTPSQEDGSFDNRQLAQAMSSVAGEVRRQAKRDYIFNINSTVTPSSCERFFKPLLEEALGARCGIDFGLAYNPEFIALGNVIAGLLAPDFVLVGESDAETGALLEELYSRFCTNHAPVERMSLASAELAKISVNCAVTMKISFVNQLSAVCTRIPGADARVILRAIGKDRRIGSEYLKPGLGYGGPCFPRDNRLFQYTARSVGVPAPLAEATDQVNNAVNAQLLDAVLAAAPTSKPVGILGLAYKPLSTVVECSPGVWLCQQLARHGREVIAHDYAALEDARRALSPERIRLVDDPAGLLAAGCGALVVTCPWPQYKQLFRSSRPSPASVIIDPWGILDGELVAAPRASHMSHSV